MRRPWWRRSVARLTCGAEGGADWVDRVDRPNATIVESTRHRADFIVHHFDVGSEPLE